MHPHSSHLSSLDLGSISPLLYSYCHEYNYSHHLYVMHMLATINSLCNNLTFWTQQMLFCSVCSGIYPWFVCLCGNNHYQIVFRAKNNWRVTFDLSHVVQPLENFTHAQLHFLCFVRPPPFFAPCTSNRWSRKWQETVVFALIQASTETDTLLCSTKVLCDKPEMNKLAFASVLLVLLALLNPAFAVTGSLAVEGGAIAITLILVATFISVGIGLGTCMYRNDLCSCGRKYGAV